MLSYDERKKINLPYQVKLPDYGIKDLEFIKDLFSKLGNELTNENINILEIGSCMGHCSNFIQTHIKGSRVIATDLIGKVIKKAKGNYPGLMFCQLDAEGKLPFKSGSIDIVFNTNLLEHLFDLDTHLKEVHRILNHGGIYLAVTPNKMIDALYFKYYKRLKNYSMLHPSTQSYFSISRLFKRHNYKLSFLRAESLSSGEKMKLHELVSRVMPDRFSTGVADRLEKIICKLPLMIRPCLVVIARKQEK